MIYLEIYFVILAVLLLVCVKVDIALKKYKTIDNKKNLSGMEVTRNLLDDNKLENVYVIEKRGKFIDRYFYNRKTVGLSSEVFHENSLYALAVGAYVGMHGVYDKKNNSLDKFVETVKPIKAGAYLFSLFVLVMGVFSVNEAAFQIALVFFLLSIILSVLEFVVNKNIAYDTYDYLKKSESFDKEEDEAISDILQNVYLESFTWFVVRLWFSLVNVINEGKKK
jgi:Zn-dependent membrane protease YugP